MQEELVAVLHLPGVEEHVEQEVVGDDGRVDAGLDHLSQHCHGLGRALHDATAVGDGVDKFDEFGIYTKIIDKLNIVFDINKFRFRLDTILQIKNHK